MNAVAVTRTTSSTSSTSSTRVLLRCRVLLPHGSHDSDGYRVSYSDETCVGVSNNTTNLRIQYTIIAGSTDGCCVISTIHDVAGYMGLRSQLFTILNPQYIHCINVISVRAVCYSGIKSAKSGSHRHEMGITVRKKLDAYIA
jgi:hypothetical protein